MRPLLLCAPLATIFCVSAPSSPLLRSLLWIPFFTAPFIAPNIYADGIARDLFVLASALLTAATLYHQNENQNTNISRWFFLLLLLLPSTILLASHTAQAPWFVWRQSLYLTAAWLTFAMLDRQHNPVSWMYPLLIFAHLYVIYALVEAFHLEWFSNGTAFLFWSDKTARFPGPLRQQNQQALFLVLAIIFTWRQGITTKHKLRWEALSLLPIAGVFLTASRSGLVVLILAALLIWILDRFQRQTLWILMRTIGLGAIISVAILAITPTANVGGVTAHIQQGLTDDTPSIRIMVWNICLHLWLQHPWLGVGWGNLAAHLYDSAAPILLAHREFNAIAS
ncbi:MAG: O-antigen ligase family protein, partial [Mariprofundales bacterium]